MRGIGRHLGRVVEDGLEEVLVEVRRDDRRRVLLAIQQEQQLRGSFINVHLLHTAKWRLNVLYIKQLVFNFFKLKPHHFA
jgi:hypothetical protein